MPIDKEPDKINKSVQEMGNLSFDTKYNINTVEILSESEDGNSIVRNKPLATSDNQLFGFINFKFDSVYLTEPDTVTEVYTYKLSGDTVATITIIYTDATKETLISCIRS